jgi:hypothetical protein
MLRWSACNILWCVTAVRATAMANCARYPVKAVLTPTLPVPFSLPTAPPHAAIRYANVTHNASTNAGC